MTYAEKKTCPEGYSVNDGRAINMLGKREMWRIYENHAEPDLTRIPQDLFGYGAEHKHIPKEWGKCLYYKLM